MNIKESFVFTKEDNVPSQVGPFSHVTKWGDLLFVTGQMPTSPQTGKIVGDDVVTQTRQVFENLSAVIGQFSATLNDALMVRVYLRNFDDYDVFNEEYKKWFTGKLPSRTCIGVTGLAVDALVEIDLVVGVTVKE